MRLNWQGIAKMNKSHILLGMIAVVGLASFLIPIFLPDSSLNPNKGTLNWGLFVSAVMFSIIAAFLLEFERITTSSKEIGFIAILGAVSAASRIPFAAIPGIQPCTYIIICTGCVFGPVAGFMVGAVTSIVSNLFLGMGPWTLYQVFAWGLVGSASGFLKPDKTWKLCLMGLASGFFFGWVTNMWFWSAFIHPLSLTTFLAVQANSLWFDGFHAAGNFIFLGFLGLKTIRIFERYRKRFHVERL